MSTERPELKFSLDFVETTARGNGWISQDGYRYAAGVRCDYVVPGGFQVQEFEPLPADGSFDRVTLGGIMDCLESRAHAAMQARLCAARDKLLAAARLLAGAERGAPMQASSASSVDDTRLAVRPTAAIRLARRDDPEAPAWASNFSVKPHWTGYWAGKNHTTFARS